MLIIFLAMLAGASLVLGGHTDLLGIPLSSRPLNLESLVLFFGLLTGAADPARKLSDVFTQLQAGGRRPTGSTRSWTANQASAIRSIRRFCRGTPRRSCSRASILPTSPSTQSCATSTCGSGSARLWPWWAPAAAGKAPWQT